MTAMKPSSAASSRLFGFAVACVLTACAVGPDYVRPEVPVSPAFRELTGPYQGSPALGANWWAIFKDADLDALEADALKANDRSRGLREGWAGSRAQRCRQLRILAGAQPGSFPSA